MQTALSQLVAPAALAVPNTSQKNFRKSSRTVTCQAVTRNKTLVIEGNLSSEQLGRRYALGAVVTGLSSVLMGPAFAALNNKKGSDDAYADMMAAMAAKKKEGAAPALTADSMYKDNGGACGPGYELKVVKVLGASCECVDESKCDSGRQDMTASERSLGIRKKPPGSEPEPSGPPVFFTREYE
ncbi:hypothetical protein CYMTET_22755 [Cymbomonas tetramitiformis]|uniref:Uncharacterized protein n=1 Tax=Cymbomonas tetramitiformis TaxID=36881 RepID=A0AAE0FZL3_9CHLO|nr:hypothetical protein CYMTET_22755 [Cymbomonas tetramitiformis]